jgi:hypothetical protein
VAFASNLAGELQLLGCERNGWQIWLTVMIMTREVD